MHLKAGSGKKKMRLGLGIIALGVLLLILGQQKGSTTESSTPSAGVTASPSYRAINPIDTGADVVEFFWYGCPHCLNLEKSLRQQDFLYDLKSVQLDGHRKATFRRLPATLNAEWTLDARLYYALSEMGVSDRGHIKIMALINKYRPKTRDDMLHLLSSEIVPELNLEGMLTSWRADKEVDERMFSTATDEKLRIASDIESQAGITGVPVMIVGGNKVVSLGVDASYESLGPNVLALIKQSQK
jgi:thiol:disulfide interchange protein DsbA